MTTKNGTLLRLVGFFLLATAALLVWVGVETVRASGDAGIREGLDYGDFLSALDDLTRGGGDSALLSVRSVEARVGREIFRFDTLEIIADENRFPAFQEGGFLFDQVRIYNRFQRERIALARIEPAWFGRLRAYNPSVFRPYRRGDGSTGLTRAASAWSLRVRSPLDGEWTGEIVASDVHRGQGLLSPRLSVALRKPIRLVRDVEGRRQRCEFVPRALDVRAYCLSEERIPQATFRLASGDRDPEWAVAGWDDLWVDGRRIRAGDSVGMEDGTVLRLNPLEPVVFGEYWEGVLSSRQWINGGMRRRTDLSPPLDLFSPLSWDPAPPNTEVSSTASLRLSVSAEASTDLTSRLAAFLRDEVRLPLDFGIMVLARVPDGEIVAMAEVGDRRNRGRSSLLERVAPGSAVKPMLAAAILSERPELAALEIPAHAGSIRSVLGLPPVPARRAFTTALNCPRPGTGRVDLRYFLRCSNNEYAASLLVAGLENAHGEEGRRIGAVSLPLEEGRVPRSILLLSPLSTGMSRLFDLPTDPVIADSAGRSRRVWDGLRFSDGAPALVPYELLPTQSRPALLAPGSSNGTELGLLYRYAYGAWENQWTLLDLTNAFARVVTDRRVQIRFFPLPERERANRSRAGLGAPEPSHAAAHGRTAAPPDSPGRADPSSTPPEGSPLGLDGQPWYGAFLAGLEGVAEDGTASGLRRAWQRAGVPGHVWAKTGTLAEAGEPGSLDDLFAKSLLFAVGDPEEGAGGPLGCGIVGGLYMRFARGPVEGALPSYPVEFARDILGAFLRDRWTEISGCEPEG